ncbi:MAG: TAXI family TRAP transporter solute-binding subunit [Desulfobacterales bacterium]|nr:TAXI family TRAP transporter solute-binding subunit [Desulfobacterales bacterium]
MKKTFICLVTVGWLLSLLTTGMPAQAAKVKLMVAAFPTNFSYYPPTIVINDLIMRHTDLDITIQSMGGSQAMPGPVEQGKADILGPLTITTMAAAYFGVGDFKDNPHRSLRMFMVLGELPQSYLTTARAGITTIAGLKGKKVGKGLTLSQAMPEAILRAYGLDLEKDIRWSSYGGSNDMYKDLAMRRIDAFFDSVTGAKIIQLKQQSQSEVVLLPIEKAQWELAAKAEPDAFIGSYQKDFPLKQLSGVSRPDPAPVTIKPMGIGASKNVPDEVAYLYVKTMIEHQKDLQKGHARLKEFSSEIAVPLPPFPYHPGAIKVYKELGLWTAAHEAGQQKMLQ